MQRPDDPVWKLKCVTQALVSGLHLPVENGTKAPLNPILGETLVQVSESGMHLYCEQTSHHPPITNFLIEGPPDLPFVMDGHCEFQVQI